MGRERLPTPVSGLENSMDWSSPLRVAKGRTRLSNLHFHFQSSLTFTWGSSTIPTGGNSRGMRFAGAWVSPPCLTAFSQKRGEQLSGRGTVSVASFGRIRSLIPRATRLPQTVQGVRVGADLDLSPRPRDMEDLSACAPGPVRGWLKL